MPGHIDKLFTAYGIGVDDGGKSLVNNKMKWKTYEKYEKA